MPIDNPLAGGQGTGSQPDAVLGGVSDAGTPTPNQNDKGGKPDLSKYVPVEDLRRMQSTYDQKLARQEKQFAEMQKQYDELKAWREKNETEGLSDEELAAYMAQKAEYEANQKIAQANQKTEELEYERNKLMLQTYYRQNGAPDSIFKGTDDPAEWQDAFIHHLKEEAKRAADELAKLKNGQNPATQAPTVTTHKPAAGSLGKIKFSDIKLGSKEERELFAKLDSGALKPEDVDFS